MRTIETDEAVTPPPATIPRNPPPGATRSTSVASGITTALFAALMALSGAAFVLGPQPVTEGIRHLGYPGYFRPLLGLAKLLGVAALLVPGARRLREWAYAGFTFVLIAAILSHVLSGDGLAHAAPATFSLGLLLASYALRRQVAAPGSDLRGLPSSHLGARGFWRVAPWLSRLALLPLIVIFVAVAARNLADPVGASAGLGISLATPQAVTTTRIGFGAFPLAFALFLAACLLSRRRVLVGLTLAVTVAAVVTVVRALGIAIDGTALASVRLLRAEVVLLAVLLAGIAIEFGRRRRHDPT